MPRGGERFAVLVHDPDGDLGDAVVLGAFRTEAAAQAKRDRVSNLRTGWPLVEAIVVPLWPGSAPTVDLVDHFELGAR